MLAEAAKFVTENPILILVGFFCSIIGTIEIICSTVLSLKTKKAKKQLEKQVSDIHEFLNDNVEFAKTSIKLNKAKEELHLIRKQIDIDLPKERKYAVVIEQIKHEEQIIKTANQRLEELKNKLEAQPETVTNKHKKLFFKIRGFVMTEKTKSFATLLLFLASFLCLMNTVFGGITVKAFGILCIGIALYYAFHNYEKLQTEATKSILNNIMNIAVYSSFFDALLNSNIIAFVWWAVLILLLSFFRKTSNILTDTILPLICISLFMAVFIFSDYETIILLSILCIQITLIIINAIQIARKIQKA